jgi:hypothetical protein
VNEGLIVAGIFLLLFGGLVLLSLFSRSRGVLTAEQRRELERGRDAREALYDVEQILRSTVGVQDVVADVMRTDALERIDRERQRELKEKRP